MISSRRGVRAWYTEGRVSRHEGGPHMPSSAPSSVTTAPASEPPAQPRRRRPAALWVGSVAVVAVVMAAIWFTTARQPKPPFTADDVRPSVQIATGSNQRVQAAVDSWTSNKRELLADVGDDEISHVAV